MLSKSFGKLKKTGGKNATFEIALIWPLGSKIKKQKILPEFTRWSMSIPNLGPIEAWEHIEN